jgi:hypothetical protein
MSDLDSFFGSQTFQRNIGFDDGELNFDNIPMLPTDNINRQTGDQKKEMPAAKKQKVDEFKYNQTIDLIISSNINDHTDADNNISSDVVMDRAFFHSKAFILKEYFKLAGSSNLTLFCFCVYHSPEQAAPFIRKLSRGCDGKDKHLSKCMNAQKRKLQQLTDSYYNDKRDAFFLPNDVTAEYPLTFQRLTRYADFLTLLSNNDNREVVKGLNYMINTAHFTKSPEMAFAVIMIHHGNNNNSYCLRQKNNNMLSNITWAQFLDSLLRDVYMHYDNAS